MEGSGAAKAGLKKNDHILFVGATPTPYQLNVMQTLQHFKGGETDLKVLRGKDTVTLHAQVSADGKLGLWFVQPTHYFELAKRSYNFVEAFPAGVHKANESLSDYIQNLRILFTVKDAHKSLVGFIGIAKIYSPTWDWERFWNFTGFLSLMLAVMNILPIPALDGGHVMFLLYEVITRRKPNEKWMEYAQYAGMILLLSAMLYVNGHDVVKLFVK